MKKIIVQTIAIMTVLFVLPLICYADSAQVLPKGVWSFSTTYFSYFDINKRFDPDGKEEDLAINYNLEINSENLPIPGLPAGENLGRTDIDFTLDYKNFRFGLSYGITDKLSFGVLIPYFYARRKVKADINTDNASYEINTAFDPTAPIAPPNVPFLPKGASPFVRPLTMEDAQAYLGDGLDINGDGTVELPGFGYKPLETWSGSGICDMELAAKYQFMKTDQWRLAFSGGARLPTGEADDPDDPVDIPFGDGQVDLLFRFHGDYTGIKNLLLNVGLGYDLQLPDKEETRVPTNVNEALVDPQNKEKVDRDLGDVLILEIMGNYSFTKQISGGLKYQYLSKSKDDIKGDKGLEYSSLEEETDFTAHQAAITLGYSTVQLYLEKKASVPFSVNLTYRDRFDGTNNAYKSRYISSSLEFYF